MSDISDHLTGPGSADSEPQLSGGSDPLRGRAVVVHPDGHEESFLISPPKPGAKRSGSSPLPDSPPPKLTKESSVSKRGRKRKGTSKGHPSQPDFSGLIQAAMSAVLPPHLLQFLSDLQANPPAIAHSAGGADRGGRRRSTPPSSTVTSEMLRASAANDSDVSVGAGQTASQLAGPDPVSSRHAPPSGLSQLAGQSRSLLSQTSLVHAPPLGRERSVDRRAASGPPLGPAAQGTERDGTSPFPAASTSAVAPLPVSAGSPLPAQAGSGVALPADRSTPSSTADTSGQAAVAHAPSGRDHGQPAASAPSASAAQAQAAPAPSVSGQAPLPAVSDDGFGAGIDDAVSEVGDTASTIGSEAQPEQDLASRPYQDILEVVSSFLPEAVVRENAPERVTSFFSSRLPAGTGSAATLKAVQSPLLATSLQAALAQLRGPSASATANADLPSYPNGLKPGKFAKIKPPPFLKEGVVDGAVPRLPPPVTPSDLAFVSTTPGQSIASVPLAQLLTSESTLLSAMDLVSLSDIIIAALAAAMFVPGSAEFRDGTESIQVWRLLQFLESLQKTSARLLSGLFLSSILLRRDHVISASTGLSPEVQTSLRLAPISSTSLFGSAARSAAEVSSQENQQRAFQAVVSLATSQATRGGRGSGSRANRGRGAASGQSVAPAVGRTGGRVRGGSRSRSRSSRGRGAGKGKQAAAATTPAAGQQAPQ